MNSQLRPTPMLGVWKGKRKESQVKRKKKSETQPRFCRKKKVTSPYKEI